MEIFEDLNDIRDIEPTAVALGNFDGVHLGHQKLISEAVKCASERGLKSAVFTFSNHPRDLLPKSRKVKNILYKNEKAGIIGSLGVDYLFNVPFTRSIMTMMGEKVPPVSIPKVLEGIGVTSIRTVDPLDLEASMAAVSAAADEKGVRAIIFKSPCIALFKAENVARVEESECTGCMRCIRELGCPAIITRDGRAYVDDSLCNGCGLCTQICPAGCLEVIR